VPDVRDVKGSLKADPALAGTFGSPSVKGEAVLAGGSAVLPALGVTLGGIGLVARGDGTVAGLVIRGTLSHPETTVLSEPPMGQADALPYIPLGHPLNQTTQQEGRLVTSAAGSVGIKGGNLLVKQLAARFGLFTRASALSVSSLLNEQWTVRGASAVDVPQQDVYDDEDQNRRNHSSAQLPGDESGEASATGSLHFAPPCRDESSVRATIDGRELDRRRSGDVRVNRRGWRLGKIGRAGDFGLWHGIPPASPGSQEVCPPRGRGRRSPSSGSLESQAVRSLGTLVRAGASA
jgi:hypothetical protein